MNLPAESPENYDGQNEVLYNEVSIFKPIRDIVRMVVYFLERMNLNIYTK